MSPFQKLISILQKHTLILVSLPVLLVVYLLHLPQQYLGISLPEEIALIILIITALLWILETVPLYVTSFLVLLLQVLWLFPELEGGGEVNKTDFFVPFFGEITLLFMGGFVLSALLNKYGLANRMAQWMLQRTGSSPSRVLLGIMIVSSVLSMWMSNTATAAMMFAIITPVILQLPKTSPFSKAMAIGIPFACNLGGMGTPIGTPPNAIAMDYLQQVDISISFSTWMALTIPLVAILIFLTWRLLLKIFPPGDVQVQLPNESYDAFTRRQIMVIGIFFLTVFAWLTTGWTGLSTGIVGLIVVIVSFGLGFLNTRDFRGISWDILFMLGGGLSLGVGLRTSGLTNTIAEVIPVEQGFWLVISSMMVLAAIMTTFMSNTATANLLIPVAISLPHNQMLIALAISIMCSSAMALPVSTPPNAIAFGSGLLKSRDMIVPGLWITVIALGLTILGTMLYFPLFF